MRPLLVNVSDSEGGAARVTQRLHRQFLREGIDSRFLVQYARSDDQGLIAPSGNLGKFMARLRPRLDALPLLLYPRHGNELFSPSVVPDHLRRTIRAEMPDVVHLNWICKGFVRIESIARIRQPVVWTLHDSWGFTGGCHVPMDCVRYREGCGECPQLPSHRKYDLSRSIYRRKARLFSRGRVTVVCPSTWLTTCARSSPLLQNTRIETIPNGVDIDAFKPVDKKMARRILGLPPEPSIILFGAMGAVADRNKGFFELSEAIARLSRASRPGKILLVVFGSSKPQSEQRPGVPVMYLGRLFDDASLCLLYSAADAFVAPSRQENLPTTVLESMACGTPTIAFNCSGFPDLVQTRKSGYLAVPYDPEDLARGIAWVLDSPSRAAALGAAAREKVEKSFVLKETAARYVQLYEDLIQ
ncbi:MAG TPA: glycosyltransferase family 4 protein [Spirochaetia bacterium]|nr:glycosyltransferase family 4 protein [Spirochaetia bacterium]